MGQPPPRKTRLRCREPPTAPGEPGPRRRLPSAPQDGAAGLRRGRAEAAGGSAACRAPLVLAGKEGGRRHRRWPLSAPLSSPRFPSAPLAQWSHGLSGWVRGSALRRLRSRPPASLGRGRTDEGGREEGGQPGRAVA